MLPFYKPNAKITRALEHLNALREMVNVLRDSNLYEISQEIDPESADKVWRLDSDLPEIPPNFCTIVGDCLFNFRSALDHLMWQLVLLNGRTPTDRTKFPLFIYPAKYPVGKRRKVKGISEGAVAIIDRLQPCSGGVPALWTLHELSKTDKHSYLNVVITVMNTATISGPRDFANSRSRVINGPIYCGAELYRINGDMPVRFNPTFEVAFDQPPMSGSTTITNILASIQLAVKEVFLSLECVFRRQLVQSRDSCL